MHLQLYLTTVIHIVCNCNTSETVIHIISTHVHTSYMTTICFVPYALIQFHLYPKHLLKTLYWNPSVIPSIIITSVSKHIQTLHTNTKKKSCIQMYHIKVDLYLILLYQSAKTNRIFFCMF